MGTAWRWVRVRVGVGVRVRVGVGVGVGVARLLSVAAVLPKGVGLVDGLGGQVRWDVFGQKLEQGRAHVEHLCNELGLELALGEGWVWVEAWLWVEGWGSWGWG